MRIQMLPSTIDRDGKASARQHLLSFVINDTVAVDAGSLAFSCTDEQRRQIRDIVLTHTHLDHIAGLPMFIDDLFATLEQPVCVHATEQMVEILEKNIFNWEIYPRFSELSNKNGKVLEYRTFEPGDAFSVADLRFQSVPVNHQVAAYGYLVSDGKQSIAITGDTAETDDFWKACNERSDLAAVFVECAFPNELKELAAVSCHLTPSGLKKELAKLRVDTRVFIINLKPMYRGNVIKEIGEAGLTEIEVLELGRAYDL